MPGNLLENATRANARDFEHEHRHVVQAIGELGVHFRDVQDGLAYSRGRNLELLSHRVDGSS